MDFSTCYRLTLISTLLVEALLAGGGVKRALKKKPPVCRRRGLELLAFD